MSSYRYDKKAFGISVTFTGVFCLLVGLYAVAQLIGGNSLFWFVLLVCIYQCYNTFVSISNPETVTLSAEEMSFSAYGTTHSFRLKEITELRIREVDQHKKMYLRINEPTLRRGRYWINCGKMEGGQELWDKLVYLEYRIDPGQLKFRARTPVNPFGEMDDEAPSQSK